MHSIAYRNQIALATLAILAVAALDLVADGPWTTSQGLLLLFGALPVLGFGVAAMWPEKN